MNSIHEGAGTKCLRDYIVATTSSDPSSLVHETLLATAAHIGRSQPAARFLDVFQFLGIRAKPISRPEIFATSVSRRFVAHPDEYIVHLAVGDFERFRVLKGAYNIAYVDWAYGAISTSIADGDSLWKNQLWVMSRFDEIWVGSSFLRDVLRKSGLRNVQLVPKPVPDIEHRARMRVEEVIGTLQAVPLWFDFSMPLEYNEGVLRKKGRPFIEFFGRQSGQEYRRVYLTIADPEDSGKNVEAAILAFVQFSQRYPGNFLIVKFPTASEMPLSERVARGLRHRINRLLGDGTVASQSVLFIDDYLGERAMMDLVGAADFYVSTSFAESLNLSVLEAMSHRTVAISPIHTGMSDYLTEENCIVCTSMPLTQDCFSITGYRAGSVVRNVVSIENAYQALEKSLALSVSDLEEIRLKAMQAAEAYTMAKVSKTVAARLDYAVGVLSRTHT